MFSEGKLGLILLSCLTLTLLMWTIWRAPTNASKWRMGFNSAFKGLRLFLCRSDTTETTLNSEFS